MFGRLLTPLVTPLVSRFDLSPRPEQSFQNAEDLETASAENFARDVMIEVMRNSIESLKEANSLKDKIQLMNEIHRIMVEEACTKNVFRELDGYLLTVNILAILQAHLEQEDINEVQDGARLAFILLAESLSDQSQNQNYFKKHVGYDTIGATLIPLLKDSRTIDHTLGLILSASQENFSLVDIFCTLRSRDDPNTKPDFSSYKSLLGTIKHVEFLTLLISILPSTPGDDPFPLKAVFALLELLISYNHRNKVLLSSTSLFRNIFDYFMNTDNSDTVVRPLLHRILRKLLEIGVDIADVRTLFRSVIRKDRTLDTHVLEIVRSGIKAKWPMHLSMGEKAYMSFMEENVRGLPSTGLTFMIWLYIEQLPSGTSCTIFSAVSKDDSLLKLSLRDDGLLELRSSGNKESAVFQQARLPKGKWTHVTLIHHPHRASNPTIRIFLDGLLVESRQWPYPRTDSTTQVITYSVGGKNTDTKSVMNWCLASAYLLSLPIADDLPRIIHHLGPRYMAHFQAQGLHAFLTYEAATSLNIYLSGLVAQRHGSGKLANQVRTNVNPSASSMLGILADGIGISEDAFIFSISPFGYRHEADDSTDSEPLKAPQIYILNGVSNTKTLSSSGRMRLEVVGDIFPVTRECLDVSLSKIGGAPVALYLVEQASTSHELSRALGVFVDGARTSWQMSDDMERLGAYEILAHILRTKSQLINFTSFETLFEFFGVNSRTPDTSVIANTLAYRVIALDFGIWSLARPEIQQTQLEHFSTLLITSKFRLFNAKQRIAKLGVVRKILFALQTNWFSTPELLEQLISALKIVSQACFIADETIKPIVSYLAANLHEDRTRASSPRSTVSHIDDTHIREKAEKVLVAFVSILSIGSNLGKLSAALPLPRICLLLLGDQPTPIIATQVLAIIALALKTSTSFSRKFELVSGWTVLKVTIPSAWNAEVQTLAFDILLGRNQKARASDDSQRRPTIACSQIAPTILASLDYGLSAIVRGEGTHIDSVESLLEELINLQSDSPEFRLLFKSQQTTEILISAYSEFVSSGLKCYENRHKCVRVLEKMNHLVLALAMDKIVNNSQRQEMMNIFKKAEVLLTTDPYGTEVTKTTHVEQRKRPGSISHVAQASVQVLGERAYQRTAAKLREWRKNIILNEKKRLRRTAIDIREYRRRVEQSTEWRNSLHDDRGLWPVEQSLRSWLLDETEGPCRTRKKLERQFKLMPTTVSHETSRIISEPDGDAQSFIQVELVVPPWAEGYEFQSTEGEDWIDDIADDKQRRVRRELMSGDTIEAFCNVTRIVGVDSSPGLLILGRNYLYMLDGLVENEEGEVIEAQDAPRNLLTVPGSVLDLEGKQKAQKWSFDQLASFSRKTCLFRDVALELYFKNSRSLLIVFPNKKLRQEICDRITKAIANSNISLSRSPLLFQRSPLVGKMHARVLSGVRDELSIAQRKWQAREISNFTYISILNQTSGRTPGDATQYPVFPWIIADYTSETLDLNLPSSFRDLTRPMGALSEARRDAARQRYENLKSVGEVPFHYGTHFSSSMIVCHFMIRLEPFTHMFKTLQGGDWDLPDRLFIDISRAYNSASQDVRGDVRELIPEFFTCPEFLQNLNNLDFGVQQSTGEKIHDVKLPPWAKNDPLLFILEHRKALESDFVSENLPAWIDLIWGFKQRDADALNVFHPLSYEGSIDLDKITDELEREATVGIIHNFGQTPRKLFDTPHPPRYMQGPTTLPLGTQYGIVEDIHQLIQSSRPVAEIPESVASLVIDMVSERIIPCPVEILCIPQYPHEQIAWGFVDQSVKLLVDKKVIQVAEAVSCLCVASIDSENLITGSTDSMVRLWKLTRRDGRTSLSLTHMLRGHEDSVLCVAACKAWSLAVSGSKDGSAIIWDLNRAVYVRSIYHVSQSGREKGKEDNSVYLVAINESTGFIATCSAKKLCLHTLNAYPIAELDLTLSQPSEGRITSLAFHEREYSRIGLLATGTSTGAIVFRTWTVADTPPGEKAQWRLLTLRTVRSREGFGRYTLRITALQFVGETLYHGDENGTVFSWDLPD